MRISDWSSDVCSSDLRTAAIAYRQTVLQAWHEVDNALDAWAAQQNRHAELRVSYEQNKQALHAARSEEHTSELQSLMRISYAVFCLKKKKRKKYEELKVQRLKSKKIIEARLTGRD